MKARLDRRVSIAAGEKNLFKDIAPRAIRQRQASLAERGDPSFMFDGSRGKRQRVQMGSDFRQTLENQGSKGVTRVFGTYATRSRQ